MKNTRNDVAPFITLKDNGRVNKLATLEKFNKAVDDFILKCLYAFGIVSPLYTVMNST